VKYAIVIEKVPGSNYSAYAPDLPGCVAAADTLEEVKQLMQEGIEFHLEGMREDGLPIPEPTTQVDYADVAA
jgi:predicted RNase H-like HicB family nuclease